MNHERHADLLQAIVDNLVGVSYRKAGFMLAMAGLHEYMCIDSNVARATGVEVEDSNDFSSASHYMDVCSEIYREVVGNNYLVPLFVVQWAIYDFERGEHARHMPYFREVLA
jgi:hypothetical protein